MLACSIASAPIEVIEIGTSWVRSARRCAVTMMASSSDASLSLCA